MQGGSGAQCEWAQCREGSMWVGLSAGRGWGSMQGELNVGVELDAGRLKWVGLNVGAAQCRKSSM